MVAKSSAARGRFTAFPPIRLVEFWWRFYGPGAGESEILGRLILAGKFFKTDTKPCE
jgi:hypothetical protein